MKPAMYLIVPTPESLPMTPGKMAAQAAHAAVEAFRLTPDNNTKRMWDCGGHNAKVVLMTDDLYTAYSYIRARDFRASLIIDEGRTEFSSDLTPTAIGVEILDKDNSHVRETFSAFKLYSDPSIERDRQDAEKYRDEQTKIRAWLFRRSSVD